MWVQVLQGVCYLKKKKEEEKETLLGIKVTLTLISLVPVFVSILRTYRERDSRSLTWLNSVLGIKTNMWVGGT